VRQSLRVHLTQCMLADSELTGIVAEHDTGTQKPLGVDAARQRPFSGDLHWIRRDPQCTDAEPVEIGPPSGLIGKARLRVRRQLGDDRAGKGTVTHVAQRSLIDHVVSVGGTQLLAVLGEESRRDRQSANASPGAWRC
jgi:hypothetical protein